MAEIKAIYDYEEGEAQIKGPKAPNPSDYYNIEETEEERILRIELEEEKINE